MTSHDDCENGDDDIGDEDADGNKGEYEVDLEEIDAIHTLLLTRASSVGPEENAMDKEA